MASGPVMHLLGSTLLQMGSENTSIVMGVFRYPSERSMHNFQPSLIQANQIRFRKSWIVTEAGMMSETSAPRHCYQSSY
jgi:hypothetical protein